ncbi:MAG: cellulose synthase operon protein YhjQ/BcsQ [Acidocella sp.]|nr:cellulose synthase operon protein YhjQ/BcsQ [Acidocella sp.]
MSGIGTSGITFPNPPVSRLVPSYPSAYGQALPPPQALPKREKFIGFAYDEASAAVLHGVLSPYLHDNNQIHVVNFRTSLAILAAMTTPEIVIIDLSGEDQPINAVMELAEVVEPGTTVLAIGETMNVNFYRTVTKGMGIKEYLPKPLNQASLEQNFLPIIRNMAQDTGNRRNGRFVMFTGTRGGTGTSTVATNLAWLIGNELHRHTALVDADLYTGTIALNLNLSANNGLGTALAVPERVDQLLLERSMQPAGDRLHVLAGQEGLGKDFDYKPGSGATLVKALHARYNFVVMDAGNRLSAFSRDLMSLAQQHVIVMDPSMISVRNLERLQALARNYPQTSRPLVVLNKAQAPGGLSQSYLEQNMGMRFDAVIPDLPRIVPKANQFGTPAASVRGPFRDAIATLAKALGATPSTEAP